MLMFFCRKRLYHRLSW